MNERILLIGFGNLGRLLFNDWYKNNYNISIVEKNKDLNQNIKKKFSDIIIYQSLKNVKVNQYDIVILCIKPNNSMEVLKLLSNGFSSKQILVSLVAGLQIKVMNDTLGKSENLFRVMPNILSCVKSSSTALFSKKKISTSIKLKVDKLFSVFGKNLWLKEEDEINFFTAMFGGGPAYFFFFLNILTEISIKNGIKPNIAFDLVKNLLKGTHEYLSENKESLSNHISKVTSKGGTTEEAISFLKDKDRFYDLLSNAILKAEVKSKKISFNLKVK